MWLFTVRKLATLRPQFWAISELIHYIYVIMGTIASQITRLTIVYSTVYSGTDQRSKKTPKLRVTGLCAGNSPGPVNSPNKWPVTLKMFLFDDVIMFNGWFLAGCCCLQINVIVESSRLNKRLFVWGFIFHHFSDFTEIPHRPRRALLQTNIN